MTKRCHFLTGLLAAVLAFVMLSSAVYIAVEADHDCSGEDCAICHRCVYIYAVQGTSALHGDYRYTYARFSKGEAFELNRTLQGRSLSFCG